MHVYPLNATNIKTYSKSNTNKIIRTSSEITLITRNILNTRYATKHKHIFDAHVV